MKIRRSIETGFALVILALTAVGAQAQNAAAIPDREELVSYTRAHRAMNEARDEFHGKVARVHDPEGRLRAREEVEAAIEGILESHEMTRERYDEITLLISLDGVLRDSFEAIMAELDEEGARP